VLLLLKKGEMGKRLSSPETVLATAHLNNMGRDEMNLAEFPLATLADRVPRGCKTLVFEVHIGDGGYAQPRVRRLTISASDKYGLPTAIDDEVILGLVQVTKAVGFADRRVRFSRYQLIHLLGWRDEGRSYRRLEQSLKRWLGVTLYYENAWRDNSQKRWVDAHFHLLDDLVLYRLPKPHAGVSAKASDAALSSFTWNEMVFHSFQAGFLKQLDLDLYRHLKLATAKRMYRFLDKRFHFSNTLRFKLPVFACEHIGLSRRYDAAQLKRRLSPAVEELEQAGYLVPLPAMDRFHRLRRGDWEVVFVRAPKIRNQRKPAHRLSDLESRLVERGVTMSSAAQLVRKHPANLILGKIEVFDTLRGKGDRRISRNPAGFLVQSIRDDYAPPTGLEQKTSSANPCNTNVTPIRKGKSMRSKAPTPQGLFHIEPSPIIEILANLSPSERAEIEAIAVIQARGIPVDGYRRALAANNTALAEKYRQVILEQHIRQSAKQKALHIDNRVTEKPI
jgi:hypothetical protein